MDYNPKTGKAIEYVYMQTIDSAGYTIIAHKTNPEDSLYASYCRMKHDSLRRMTEYYFSWGGRPPAIEKWSYEGDTISIHDRYEVVADTFFHVYQEYRVHYVNPDSTYWLNVLERHVYPKDSTSHYSSFRESDATKIYFDSKQRITRVEKSEWSLIVAFDWAFEEKHTMEIEYRE